MSRRTFCWKIHPRLLFTQSQTHHRTGWGHHLEQEVYDAERTKYLESQGYKVIRFWNNDVMKDIDSVVRTIQLELEAQPNIVDGKDR